MWMIRAFGSAAWIRPRFAKLVGILSTTLCASGDKCLELSQVSLREPGQMVTAGARSAPQDVDDSSAIAASFQNGSSPAPNTAGCEASICSTSVVPLRGMPTMNIGRSDWSPAVRERPSHWRW